ncbi:MAG: FtsX-like permease family protein [Balneolaceae bacterium]
MLLFKLAFKNLIAAGLRTWLSVGVLAFAYILIIFYNGLLDGWNQQARTDSIAWEFGHGQLWHADYDPYDPFSIQEAHGEIPKEFKENLVPILVRQATIYPQGRLQSVLLKGIPANQNILVLPTRSLLESSDGTIKAIIGSQMATSTKLKKGSTVLMRWRDKNGTFDAMEIEIADVFQTNVPAVDNGTIWVDMSTLAKITGIEGMATYLVASKDFTKPNSSNWIFHSQSSLLKSIDDIIAPKKISGYIIYTMLLGLAFLAIFDTQVMSIFRRQKEIGIFIALGMTRWQVVRMFTIEGSSNSLLGAAAGAVFGTPLFIYFARNGIVMPDYAQSSGIVMSQTMFPAFGVGLVVTTIVLVIIASTVVSFLPARKIAKMDPTLALKGKIQ